MVITMHFEAIAKRLKQNQKKFNRNFGLRDVLPLPGIVVASGRGAEGMRDR
jgi:hypothetical protein